MTVTFITSVILTVIYFSSLCVCFPPQHNTNHRLSVIYGHPSQITAPPHIYNICCDHGKKHIGTRCNEWDNLPLVSPESMNECRAIFEKCCSDVLVDDSCSKGVNAALDGADCAEIHMDDSRNVLITVRECCDACRWGRETGFCPGPNERFLDPVHERRDRAFLTCCKRRPSPVVSNPSPVNRLVAPVPQQPHERRQLKEPLTLHVPQIVVQHNQRTETELNENSIVVDPPMNHEPAKDESEVPPLVESGTELVESESSQEAQVLPPSSPTECYRLNCSQICLPDTNGTLRCSCTNGFRLTSDGKSCIDIDECEKNTHNCKPEQVCVNLNSTFECIPKMMSDISFGVVNETEHSCPDGQVWEDIASSCIGRYFFYLENSPYSSNF
jgi:hypothetical protein